MIALRRAVSDALNTAGHSSHSPVSLQKGSVCAVILALVAGSIAEAQETAALEEITVTGSRIRRTTDFETPNPTTVVDSAFLENLGIVNVGEALTQLPANISTFSPTTTGNQNFFAGSTIANLRGLNPFFGSRTLNLVNNRRFVPTNQGDGVDLNFIPSILIERMDVVTGGASAAYGSGAISGVNNVFLSRKLEGVRLNVDFYQTEESDGDDKHAAIAAGTSLFDGRGHIVFGYEYQDMDPVGCVDVRDWCAEGIGFYQNPAAASDADGPDDTLGTADDPPANLLGRNVRANQISDAGVFNNFVPAFIPTFQPDATGTTLVPFTVGEGDNAVPFNSVVGGDGRSIYKYTNLRAPVERDTATVVFSLALTDSVNMSVDLSWGEVETVNRTGALDANFIPLPADNAYLQLSPALAAGNVFGLYNKDWTSQINSYSRFTTEVQRGALGFDGRFGDSTWTWDAYYQYGKTEREQLVNDNRHLNAYLMAFDAVLDGSGNPVCRVTRDGFAAAVAASALGAQYAQADPRIAEGCVPLNAFGTQAIPADAYAYSFGYLRENLDYEQQVLAANFTGDLFDGFGSAGPIQAALGLEYRIEKGENTAAEELDPWDRTDFLIQYGESFAGDVDITEGYLELNIPLLRDKPGAQLLEFNAAVRQSRYENQGKAGTTGETRTHDMTTWKIAGMWDPLDWLRFRGSVSRDSRAANFRELYYGQRIKPGGTFGFCGPIFSFEDPCEWSLEGNVDLEPEKSDTVTVGIVFTPSELLPGFQFAVDYFDIQIEDAIQQANVFRVLDGCQDSGIQEYCDLIVPDVPGDYSSVSFVRALAFNGSAYTYKGYDFTGSWLWQLNDASNLNFRLIATHMTEQLFQPVPGQPFVDITGQTGTANSFLSDNQPAADWLANLSATFNWSNLSVTANVRYISDGKMDYLALTPEDPGYPTPPVGGTTVDRNDVPSYAVWTLSGSYAFDDLGPVTSLQLFAVVDNLFDKDPPIATGIGFGAVNGGTNAVFYDTMGRAFRAGLRISF